MPFFIDQAWRAAIRMMGRDRVRFLHGMCTNDIKKLQAGQSCMATVVNRQGKMVAVLTVLAAPNTLLLITDRDSIPSTIDHLAKFIVADDVTMTPDDRRVLGLYGAPVPQELPSAVDPAVAIEGRTVLAPESSREQIVRGLDPISDAEYEARRIENGFPRWGVDMGPDHLPMEAGLEPIAISYSKGCYIGQEVIQRVKTYSEPPRMLVQLGIEGARPQEKVTAGGEEIGQVTSAAKSVALGYVRKESKQPGTKVEVGGREAVVRALPWHTTLR